MCEGPRVENPRGLMRLCARASEETRLVWGEVVERLSEVDPELAEFCVPTCVYRGGICPEPRGCGYNHTGAFARRLEEYRKLY